MTRVHAALGSSGLLALSACQVLFGFEDFSAEPTPPASTAPHPCHVLPLTKAPDQDRGPLLSRIDPVDEDCFWADQTEVTVAQYGEWLDALDGGDEPAWTDPDWELGVCQWKLDAPHDGSPSDPEGDPTDACRMLIPVAPASSAEEEPFKGGKPIRCVDWCDAQAFCAWAGKRLCLGKDPTGAVDASAGREEWRFACSDGEALAYPYGADYDQIVCNTDQVQNGCAPTPGTPGLCGVAPVGYFEACRAERPTSALDMSGNVAEWIALCSATSDPDESFETLCHLRGGSFLDGANASSCIGKKTSTRGDRQPGLGLRCCVSLTNEEEAMVQNAAAP